MSHGRPNCQYGEVRNGAAARALGGVFSPSYLVERYTKSSEQGLHQF